MNWEVYLIWEHFHWTSIVFVLVIVFEIIVALVFGRRLFSSKQKVSDKIQGIDYQRKNIGCPNSPTNIPSNRSTDSKANQKANP